MNDEDQVVALYSNLYKQSGQAFDPQRCRDWYRRCSMRVNNGHCIAQECLAQYAMPAVPA